MDKKQIAQIVHGVWLTESQAIADLRETVDLEAVAKVIELLATCRGRVITMGLGTSAAAAHKIAHTLSCVETPAFPLSPADGAHGGLGALRGEDVVVAISKGGKTEELLRIIPAIKAKGASLVVVSENENSELARASDILLRVRVDREACPFNMLATSSTLAVLAVFDAIAIALMYVTDYSRDQFAVIHPGGAVGERLKHGKGTT
ncbi:MAG: SIS domain-containing protein [Firmicutes bacterium]|nr:SIS domain-containing protein [Bacillota bacterium]